MKDNFHERRQNRLDWAKDQAEKNKEKSGAHFKSSMQILSFIPPGQPILVGHHSQKRHMRDLEKVDNHMRKSVEADEKRKYYEDKADAIENNTAIFSDDPDAIEKLKAKLAELEAAHAYMKKAKPFVDRKDKEGFLKVEGATEAEWIALFKNEHLFKPTYNLAYSSADIRRVKQRIAQLEKIAALTTKEQTIKGVIVRHNVEANRIQLVFDHRLPTEVYQLLTRRYAFRYSRSLQLFQRHLNAAGISAAKWFLQDYNPEQNENNK